MTNINNTRALILNEDIQYLENLQILLRYVLVLSFWYFYLSRNPVESHTQLHVCLCLRLLIYASDINRAQTHKRQYDWTKIVVNQTTNTPYKYRT